MSLRHPFFESSRPLVFAHRGGAALAPENTMHAFDQAVALGADGLELDVHLSKEGTVVVHHDRTMDRTTNLCGAVSAHTASDLQRAGLPTLAAVLARHVDVRVIIEMKVNSAACAEAVLAVVRRMRARHRVCLGSFGRRVLRAARQIDPQVATSAAREEVRWALYRSWLGLSPWRPAYDGFQVPEFAGSTRVVSSRFVQAAHRAGLGVQVWTVDSTDVARRLIGWGVDALITDRPDVIVPVVR